MKHEGYGNNRTRKTQKSPKKTNKCIRETNKVKHKKNTSTKKTKDSKPIWLASTATAIARDIQIDRWLGNMITTELTIK